LILELKIFLGSGPMCVGEETDKFQSMEGKRGEPRKKPPFPTQAGFKNMPTVVNKLKLLLSSNGFPNRT
jgi:[NiFe] hydrogenase diaphorase moiety large subunit